MRSMLDHYVLDENGEPKVVPLMEWAEWFQNTKDRFIKTDNLGDYRISTVFLGLEQNFLGEDGDRPILFETMVFEKKVTQGSIKGKKYSYHKSLDGYIERYCTKTEALEGHAKIVAEVKKLPKVPKKKRK